MTHDEAVTKLRVVFPGAVIEAEEVEAIVHEAVTTGNTDGPIVHDPRRASIISYARQRREVELAPLRAELARVIAEVGWQRARPILAAALGHTPKSARGSWWKRIGKRKAGRLLAELQAPPTQRRLPL